MCKSKKLYHLPFLFLLYCLVKFSQVFIIFFTSANNSINQNLRSIDFVIYLHKTVNMINGQNVKELIRLVLLLSKSVHSVSINLTVFPHLAPNEVKMEQKQKT